MARNLRTRHAEIDLLVRRGPLVVAVEVKTRRHHLAPELTVCTRQRSGLRRALMELAEGMRRRPRVLRIDVVAVRPLAADTWDVRCFPGVEFHPSPD